MRAIEIEEHFKIAAGTDAEDAAKAVLATQVGRSVKVVVRSLHQGTPRIAPTRATSKRVKQGEIAVLGDLVDGTIGPRVVSRSRRGPIEFAGSLAVANPFIWRLGDEPRNRLCSPSRG